MIFSKEEKTLLISALIYLKHPEINCELTNEALNEIPTLVRKIKDGETFELPLYYFDELPSDSSDSLLAELNIKSISSEDLLNKPYEEI